MKRVFNELTPECEITARMYAQGYEKKEIAQIEAMIEQYEETNNPEDRMDLKQSALKQIKTVRGQLPQLGLDKEEFETTTELLEDFEEVLSY